MNFNKVNIGTFSDDYLTLNIRNFESPEAIPSVLTNFLIEYSRHKITCNASTNKDGQASEDVVKEVKAINKLVQIIDKHYVSTGSFNKYTTHLPHILGLMQWDIKKTQPKKIKEIINKKLSDLEQEFNYLGDLTLADDTRSSQLEKTESLIAALKEEWRMTL